MQATADHRRRAWWLKTLHEWHWISSAICLLGMLLFAATGITLNHAGRIESKPLVVSRKGEVPRTFLTHTAEAIAAKKAPLTPDLQEWVQDEWDLDVEGKIAEWSPDEVYLSLPRPGGDAWLRIGLADGQAEYELTDRGWIAYLNDLHKGRNTGAAWAWFIDIFAGAALVFSLTGLFILKLHAANRPLTWPMVGLGVLLPLLLALLFIH